MVKPIGVAGAAAPESVVMLKDIALNTGIEPAGDLPWGSHICLFCESARDLLPTGNERPDLLEVARLHR